MSDLTPPESAAGSPILLLAQALRRERERLAVSVTELAKRAGIAKSTLSQLENGIGNPGLETLWALAMALNVPVSRLIAQPRQPVQVIRVGEGTPLVSGKANYLATLLATCPPGAQRDIYRLQVQPGEPKISAAHQPGTLEHVILSSGRARVGPLEGWVELTAGDYISYPADEPHLFEALEENTTAVMLIEQG